MAPPKTSALFPQKSSAIGKIKFQGYKKVAKTLHIIIECAKKYYILKLILDGKNLEKNALKL